MNVSTREQWIEFAGGQDEAAKYETLFVQADRSVLPACVIEVIDHQAPEPSADYWQYLAAQWLDHMWPPSPRLGTPPPPLRLVKPRGLLARLGILLLRRARD